MTHPNEHDGGRSRESERCSSGREVAKNLNFLKVYIRTLVFTQMISKQKWLKSVCDGTFPQRLWMGLNSNVRQRTCQNRNWF